MIYNTLLAVLAVSAGLLDIALGESHGRIWGRSNLSPRQNNETPSTCLAEQAIQTASFSDGQGQNDKGVKAGQAKSETSQNNFIDACDGQTLTNGLQNLDGSCNPIPMGEIPSFDNMITAIILSPENVEDLVPNTAFDIKIQVNNLIAGAFTNPDITYYTAPQRLEGGKIIGHVHVTVQDIGQANPNQPPDPKVFQFFKGIDDAGDNNGGLKATVADGLPAGFYRICTMVAARNHQPVTMPKAQRGAQDDCIRITVGQGNGAGAGNGNGGNGGQQDAGGDQQADGQQDAGGDQQAGGQQDAGGDQQADGQQDAGGDQQADGQQAAGGDQQAAGDDQQAAGGDQQAAGGDQQAAGGDQQAAGGDQQADGQQNGGGDQQADGQQGAGTDQGTTGGQQDNGQGSSTDATTTNGAGSAQPTGSTGQQQDSAGVNARGNTRGSRGRGRHQHRGNRKNRGDRGNRRKNFQRDLTATPKTTPLEARGPLSAQELSKIVHRSYHLV